VTYIPPNGVGVSCPRQPSGLEPGTSTIRALIAEPTALTREGLAAILGREPDIDLIATTSNGTDTVSAARALRPDVALLATAFPTDGGIDNWVCVATAARMAAPECQCAIMSPGWQGRDLQRAAAAGVRGFLMCDSSPELIIAAVRRLAGGGQVLDPRLSSVTQSPLTARETDVLREASGGATTAEIAGVLCLSVGTVRNYLSRAISKTGARNRIGAVKAAADAGWL
jgi:two-component system response regulator DesR